MEYFDPNCPHCRDLYPIMKEVAEEHGDQAKFAYIPFPLWWQDPSHPQYSLVQVEALHAAMQEGKFWLFDKSCGGHLHVVADDIRVRLLYRERVAFLGQEEGLRPIANGLLAKRVTPEMGQTTRFVKEPKFFEMLEAQFSTDEAGLSLEQLKGIAEEIGMDPERMAHRIENDVYLDVIMEQRRQGAQTGITGRLRQRPPRRQRLQDGGVPRRADRGGHQDDRKLSGNRA